MDYNLGPAQGRPPVRFEDLDEDARSKVTRILIDAVKEHQSVIDALRLPRNTCQRSPRPCGYRNRRTEVRKRLIKIFSASPRRAEGHTQVSCWSLFALEAATRHQFEPAQPFKLGVEQRINAIWNNIA